MALWITYAWVDNEGGNFDYLVQQLAAVGITANYDRVAFVPGRRLWEQMAQNIEAQNTEGWAILVTQNSLDSQPCMEELAYALDRVLRSKTDDFPLIGLVAPNVPFAELPAPLRTRLCISLSSPNWTEQLKAALEGRAPKARSTNFSEFIVEVRYGNDQTTLLEITPRFGQIHHWRVAIASTRNVLNYGTGPTGSNNIYDIHEFPANGNMDFKGHHMTIVGESRPIGPGTSAYVILSGVQIPEIIAVGSASSAQEAPVEWYSWP